MNDFRHIFWFRLSCVIAFVTASLIGSTHFHFAELLGDPSDQVESVGVTCSCALHPQSHRQESSDEEHDNNGQHSPANDSDHCPICKLLAELAGEFPVTELPADSELVCFRTQFASPQSTIAASSFYFGRGPPVCC